MPPTALSDTVTYDVDFKATEKLQSKSSGGGLRGKQMSLLQK